MPEVALPTDVYYGGFDPRNTTGELSLEDFERQLVSKILFEDRVLITDIFFFNSKTLLRHIKERGSEKSIFMTALAQGRIIPATRESSGDFRDIARSLPNSGAGLLKESEVDELVRLYAVHGNVAKPYVDWPTSMGGRYLWLLQQVLSQPVLYPGVRITAEDERIWNQTREFRTEVIAAAIRPDDGTVRRADIIRMVGDRLGVLPGDPAVFDPHLVFPAIPQNHPQRAAVGQFFDWLDDIYHFNQGQGYKTATDLSDQSRRSIDILANAQNGSAPAQGANWDFVDEVEIPAQDVLMRVGPERLLEVSKTAGARWSEASRKLADLRPDDSAQFIADLKRNAHNELAAYAKALRRLGGATAPLETLRFLGGTKTRETVGDIVDAVTPIPAYSLLKLGLLGWWKISYLWKGRQTVVVRRPGTVQFPVQRGNWD